MMAEIVKLMSVANAANTIQSRVTEIIRLSRPHTEDDIFKQVTREAMRIETVCTFLMVDTIKAFVKDTNRLLFIDEDTLYFDIIIDELKKSQCCAVLQSEIDDNVHYVSPDDVIEQWALLDQIYDWNCGIPVHCITNLTSSKNTFGYIIQYLK